MIFNGKEIPFPAVGKISLYKVLESLEVQSKDKDRLVAEAAKGLLAEVNQYPELREGFENVDDLKKYEGPFRKLCRMMFPDVLMTNEIKAITPPFSFTPLYCSTRFEKIIETSGNDFSDHLQGITDDEFYLYCCYFILGKYYGYPGQGGGPLMIEIKNRDEGNTRYYQAGTNADMIEFIPTEKAIDISREDFEELVDNHRNIDLWKEKFPPNSWIMRGIGLVNMMDVTNSQALSKITSNLLIKSEESLLKIREGMQSLFNNPELQSGVVIFKNGRFTQVHDDEMKSIVLGNESSMGCDNGLCGYSFDKLLNQHDPLIIPDVQRFHSKSQSQLSQSIVDAKVGSYIMIPLIFEDDLLGFMELGSPNVYELNSISISKLDPLIPILSMAMKRFKTEAQNQIEAIIQQECTTIHHSVKWRFEEEASKFLQARYEGKQPVFKNIIFKDVIPLYGQLDIKGSSTKRNEAVKSDLLGQINQIRKVLKQAYLITNVTSYEELLFRIDGIRKELNGELSAGNEYRVLEFIKTEINPVFAHLKTVDQKLGKMIDRYESLLDPKLNTLYEERKKYDSSVNKINQVLASALDNKQEEAQQIFPHYFERYKTDGVEYNMYIGQSITKNQSYDSIYLRNLRIWQLSTMWSLENDYRNLSKELDMDVEIASLVLAYSTPLAVHFRMDEKRFDVEGAYNARYEIIKKRVDKALVKGTKERITQPGKIAIVYSQKKDAVEYRQFIQFLQSKGYFKNKVEDLELEDLQGIHGLHALRVEINYTNEKASLGVDEFIKSIESVN